VRRIEGVEEAAPRVSTEGSGGTNRIIAPRGYALGSEIGPATVFESWVDEPALSSHRLVEGRPPEAPNEIALNLEAAEDAAVFLGDQMSVVGQFGPQPYTLVGVFTVGSAKSAGGGVSVEFT